MDDSSSAMRPAAIDPADQSTWPQDVMDEVCRLVARCREQDENTMDTVSCELRLESVDAAEHAEEEIRSILGDRTLAMFHATRLLRHECDAIRQEGLVVLDEDHRSRRLDRVIEVYGDQIGDGRLERLRASGPLSGGRAKRESRLGKLHVVTPLQASFDDGGSGMTVFLERWGGESFYCAAEESDELRVTIGLLTERSVPAIFKVAVHARSASGYSGLWPVFAGQLGGWPAACQVFCLHESVPPDRILAMLDPSSAGWPDLRRWASG
jgi:hypothetical protein